MHRRRQGRRPGCWDAVTDREACSMDYGGFQGFERRECCTSGKVNSRYGLSCA